MHESSLAKQILEVVLRRAAEEKAGRIRAVRGTVAETEALSPSSLDFHFQAHARGTAAEGARLDLRLIWVEARCRACGELYKPEHHILLCPKCGSLEGEELQPTGLRIEMMDVEPPVPQ